MLIILVLIFSVNVYGEFTNTDLNLRTRPDTAADILTVIPKGDEVTVKREQDGWANVEYNDEVGYVYGEYIQDEKPPTLTYLGNYFITAYEDTGLACANGAYPTVGYTIAHNTLPFGTKVYIDGVGERVVEDRGPGSLGSEWLDLYLGDPSECYNWGEQHRDVYLVEDE